MYIFGTFALAGFVVECLWQSAFLGFLALTTAGDFIENLVGSAVWTIRACTLAAV